jgi:hypothetical protein
MLDSREHHRPQLGPHEGVCGALVAEISDTTR